MPPPLLTLQDIQLNFGSATLIDGAQMSISKGERAALVGRNGAGKSTLLKMIAGLIEPDSGKRFLQPGTTTAYLPQEPDLSSYATIADYVATGLHHHSEDDHYLVEAILAEVSLDPSLSPKNLSGGESRRAAIAQALISEPDILLLDEPTNHLDLPTIEWLEERLRAYSGALVMISHDRAFLNALTNTCLWIDRGIIRTLNKGFPHFEEWSEEVIRKEEEEQHKLKRKIVRENAWLVKGVTARRKRNQGRLRRLIDLRAQKQNYIKQTGQAAIAIDSGQASGKLVIEAKNLSKSYGDTAILKDFSTRILRGDRVGIIGANGSGKTTLLKLLTGNLESDEGSVRIGTNLETAYLDQARASLKEEETLWHTLCPKGGDQVMVRGKPRHVITYLKDFLFDESQARQPVESLSGGERNRLMLAVALAKPSNLLILDEPTNDLDMDTLDLLQEVLSEYDGTLLLVSHDRDFLDRLVTSTIVLDGSGTAEEFPGGYTDAMVKLRELSAPKKSETKKTPKEAPKQKKQKSKLSYKEQRELDALAIKIPQLETEITKLEEKLADQDFFARDPAGFNKIAKQLDEIKEELALGEQRWLEIELLKEELANT